MEGVQGTGRLARVGSRRRRRLRSHRLMATLVAAIVVVGIGGVTDLAYVSLKSRADQLQAGLTVDLQAGQQELDAGKASLTAANTKHDATQVDVAVTHFAAAKNHFLAASRLADGSQLLRYLEYAPGVGDQARSRHVAVDGIASMGASISDAGQELTGLDGQLLQPPSSGAAGRTLLTVLAQTHTSLTKVRAALESAQAAAGQVDVQVLPGGEQATFLKARNTINTALSGLDEFDSLVPALTDVLGGNGPRTYLVEQVNPAELRAGGGFIGGYSVIRADHGSLTVIRSGDAYELANPRPLPGQQGFIPQPSPLREVIPRTSWSFVDSNLYPDFPSNAKEAASFAQPGLGTSVDAVISMDYYTVAKMLELTGPLAVPGYPITVDANTFIPQMIQHDLTDANHKAILTAIAGPLMERVSTLSPDRWPALIAAFNSLVARRHFQAYFNNADVESEIDRVGWSGTMNPTGTADYMMEVESNYSGSKANYFVSRHYTVVLSRSGSELHHKVTVDLVNGTPYGSYVEVDYRADVRLYVGIPAAFTLDNLIPVRYPNPDPPLGTKLFNGWAPDIGCCGRQARVVFEYDTPWSVHDRGLHELYWQKQPGTVNDKVDVIWSDGAGHTYTATGDLSQDRVITLMPNGVTLTPGEPAHATLPSLSLG